MCSTDKGDHTVWPQVGLDLRWNRPKGTREKREAFDGQEHIDAPDLLRQVAERVRFHLECGTFRHAPGVHFVPGQGLKVELMARVSLADADQVLETQAELPHMLIAALTEELRSFLHLVGEHHSARLASTSSLRERPY